MTTKWSQLAPDEKALVMVPFPFPESYEEFNCEWIAWAKQNNKRCITLKERYQMRHKVAYSTEGSQYFDGWVVDPYFKDWKDPEGNIKYWLPEKWLYPVLLEQACDCSFDEILKNGCQVPGHV